MSDFAWHPYTRDAAVGFFWMPTGLLQVFAGPVSCGLRLTGLAHTPRYLLTHWLHEGVTDRGRGWMLGFCPTSWMLGLQFYSQRGWNFATEPFVVHLGPFSLHMDGCELQRGFAPARLIFARAYSEE